MTSSEEEDDVVEEADEIWRSSITPSRIGELVGANGARGSANGGERGHVSKAPPVLLPSRTGVSIGTGWVGFRVMLTATSACTLDFFTKGVIFGNTFFFYYASIRSLSTGAVFGTVLRYWRRSL